MEARKLYKILSLVMLAALFSACEHKVLYDPVDDPEDEIQSYPVRIEFDWSALEPGDAIPEGMTLLVYQTQTGRYRKFDIPSSDNGVTQVPAGQVRMLFVQNDNRDIYVDKYASDATCQLVVSDSQTAQLTSVYGGQSQHTIAEAIPEPMTITLKPRCMGKHVNVCVRNISTLNNSAGFMGHVTGMTRTKLLLSTEVAPEEAEAVTMTGGLTIDGDKLRGTIFGLDVTPQSEHKFILSMRDLVTGSRRAFRFDVKEKVKELADKHDVSLDLDLADGEEIYPGDPDFPSSDGNGIWPSIDDFKDEEIIEEL